MKKLTTKDHWEITYRSLVKSPNKDNSLKRFIFNILRKFFGNHIKIFLQDFSRYVLRENFLKKYVEIDVNSKVLEIGCAPGHFLLSLNEDFDCIPCGVDYSEAGVQINKKLFQQNKLDPDNIVCADVFSKDFQSQHHEAYDVVISRNFFEHFQDITEVLKIHINLLKSGGKIVVTIPNLKGLNYFFTKLFNKPQMSQHNLRIMDKKYFSSLFESYGVSKIKSKYYGLFNFFLFGMRKTTSFKSILTICYGFQLILNIIFHFVFKKRRIESRLYSPYLIFIGNKN